MGYYDPTQPRREEEKRRRRNRILVAIVLVVFVFVCAWIAWIGPGWPQFPKSFEIENPRTILLDGTSCADADQVSEFSSDQEILIVWSEVNRKSGQSLEIRVLRESGEVATVLRESDFLQSGVTRTCRKAPLPSLPPGTYQIVFLIDGRPDEKHRLQIHVHITPPIPSETPNPTQTLTPTPTDMATQTTATPIFPAGFLVEHPRMTNGDVAPICAVEQVTEFLTDQDIFIAWTEKNRKSGDFLEIRIIDSLNNLVFDLKESEPPNPALASRCRIISLNKRLAVGTYITLFLAHGRPDDDHVLKFEVNVPLRTPTPSATPTQTPTPSPTPPTLLVADFDNQSSVNNLGGSMGVVCPEANCAINRRISVVYTRENTRHDRVAKLEYHIETWSAFWIGLHAAQAGADLRPYSRLTFDVRGDSKNTIPKALKIEIYRPDPTNPKCLETGFAYVSGITADWKSYNVGLADFRPTGWYCLSAISGLDNMDYLVFTFESDSEKAGQDGIIYLDNIAFRK